MSQVTALPIGAEVGGLQVTEVLGRGACAITYIAADPAIGTRFALKEFAPAEHAARDPGGRVTPSDEQSTQAFTTGLERFLAEARMLAPLEHPNIARVLRYFEANGTAYMLMPHYHGQPLHEKIADGGRFDSDRARSLLLPLMDALAYLHKRGIVHQDVKPANIHVTDDGLPLLLDFGAAAASGDDTGRFGSEGYAAPEQYSAEGEIGPWTDIYGLAATAYRCVSGRIPSPARERLAARDAGSDDPMTPFTELAPASEFGGLADAVELGLQLDARERPRSVGHWRKSFEGLDWHRSVVVRGGVADYIKERREWLPMALLAVFAATMVGVVLYLLFGDGPMYGDDAGEAPGARQVPAPVYQPPPEEVRRWQGALDADTVEGYRRFMEDFPESVYLRQAQTQLDLLDDAAWQELSAEDNIPAYEDYLELFPAGLHQAEALQRIEAIDEEEARLERERLERERQDQLAWESASKERTIESMDRYITGWPAGSHIEEAQRVRRLLQDRADDEDAFQAAQQLDTTDAYQAYINAFPAGAHVARALQRLDALDLRPGRVFRDCAACPVMAVIPGGTFWQGADETSALTLEAEKPRRLVTIPKPIAVGIHEVTMAEWDACADDGGCTVRPADNGWGRDRRPVIMVSWNDAEEYVRWLSDTTGERYRLPSESEWEYFARAGEQGEWPGGSPERICDFGNIAGTETGFRWQHGACGDGHALGTTPAGSFMANSFGLYDTVGNVQEWTADCMNLSYLDAPVNGSAWGRGICSSHMTRGGSWITGSKEIRLPARFNLKNGDRNDFTGLRVVRDVED
jgi:formylglycine-generating enzyme required for sulfatase activity